MEARAIEMVEQVPVDLSRYLPEDERGRAVAFVVTDAVDGETAHEGTPMAAADLALSQRVRLRRDYGDFVSAAETGTITWTGASSDPHAPLATVKLDLPHEDLFDCGNQLQVSSEERPGTITPDALTLLPKQPACIAHPAASTAAPASAVALTLYLYYYIHIAVRKECSCSLAHSIRVRGARDEHMHDPEDFGAFYL